MASAKTTDRQGLAAPTPSTQERRPTRRRVQLAQSAQALYEAVMRLGGEPFLAPFSLGVTSLTRGLVGRLKQRSFFGLETFERGSEGINQGRPNKFTRYGASPFHGDYDVSSASSSPQKKR